MVQVFFADPSRDLEIARIECGQEIGVDQKRRHECGLLRVRQEGLELIE
ncbi:MAG: hypothetical protein WCI75_06430 [candidate division NC10 bacterium]